jgi:hypothetical protein
VELSATNVGLVVTKKTPLRDGAKFRRSLLTASIIADFGAAFQYAGFVIVASIIVCAARR